MDTEEDREREDEERPRPRVVDKRVTARAAQGSAPESAPSEPPAPPETPAGPPPEAAPSPPPSSEGSPSAATGSGAALAGVWTPEQEAEAQRIAREVADTPSIEWVVNVAVTLVNVAGTKLDLGATADAGLAIDALAGLLNSVGSRLGTAEPALRQGLAQLQLAYAQKTATPPRP